MYYIIIFDRKSGRPVNVVSDCYGENRAEIQKKVENLEGQGYLVRVVTPVRFNELGELRNP